MALAGGVGEEVQPRREGEGPESASVHRILTNLVLTYPVMWLIGVAALFWPLAALLSLSALTRARLGVRSSAALAVGWALVISVPVGIVAFGWHPGRLIGLSANVSIWLVLATLLAVPASRRERARLATTFSGVAAVQGALIALSVALIPHALPIPLLRGLASGLPAGIANFANNRLIFIDWLETSALRSAGISGNPTWSGAVGAVAILFFLFGQSQWHSRFERAIGLLGALGGSVAVYYSLSRSTMLALAAAIVFGCLVSLWRRAPVFGATTMALVAVVLLYTVLVYGSSIASAASDLNNARAGSLMTRSAIYERSLSMVQALGMPFLGYGMKPTESGLVANVATHSTYVGILFRGGLIGLVALVVLLATLVTQSMRLRSAVAVSTTVFTVIWCVFEDLDAGHLLPIGIAVAVLAAPTSGSDARHIGGGRGSGLGGEVDPTVTRRSIL